MSTNYYADVSGCDNACEHCKESTRVHIGKSAGGWRFLFKADPEWPEQDSLSKWIDLVAGSFKVENEYGVEEDKEQFLAWVMLKQQNKSHAGPGDPLKIYLCGGFEFTKREFC